MFVSISQREFDKPIKVFSQIPKRVKSLFKNTLGDEQTSKKENNSFNLTKERNNYTHNDIKGFEMKRFKIYFNFIQTNA